MPRSPSNDSTIRTALTHHQRGELDQAEAVYRQVLAEEPENATCLHYLGLLLHRRGDGQQALELLEKSVHLDRRNATFLNNLGGVQRLMGKYDAAQRSFERAISWQPQLAQAHYNLGLTLRALRKPQAAVDSFRKAISCDARYADAMFQIGDVLREQGRREDAANLFDRVLALSPRHKDALRAAADTWTALGDLDRAVTHAAALAAQPGPAQVDWVNQVGVLYSRMNRSQEALACFEQACEMAPTLVTAWVNRGSVLETMGRRDEAVAATQRAIELDPGAAVARFNLAAMTGQSTQSAPAEFVAQLFDEYAEGFDFHLVQMLKYSTPKRLYEIVSTAFPDRQFDIMDLGCGTGLAGEAFKGAAKSMVGVDLSSGMLEKARARGLYRELLCEDMTKSLRDRPACFDLVLAADVFVYVGDLAATFAATRESLRPGGVFAFSVEALDDPGDYVLRLSRRYAHALDYIRRLATDHSFSQLACTRVVLREENKIPVEGFIVMLQAI